MSRVIPVACKLPFAANGLAIDGKANSKKGRFLYTFTTYLSAYLKSPSGTLGSVKVYFPRASDLSGSRENISLLTAPSTTQGRV